MGFDHQFSSERTADCGRVSDGLRCLFRSDSDLDKGRILFSSESPIGFTSKLASCSGSDLMFCPLIPLSVSLVVDVVFAAGFSRPACSWNLFLRSASLRLIYLHQPGRYAWSACLPTSFMHSPHVLVRTGTPLGQISIRTRPCQCSLTSR